MHRLNHLSVRHIAEEQLISEVKHDKIYEKVTDPVFTTDIGYVALSIDDGPSIHTERILEILANKRARAIFFMIGENVAKYPQVTRKVLAAGHVIGNHSYTHPFLTKISPTQAAEELARTTKIISDTTGVLPPYFRPPFGAFNEATLLLATKDAMKVVMWSADPKDYSLNTEIAVIRAVDPLLTSRNILLLHDLKEATVDALPLIIDSIRAKKLQTTVYYEH